MTKVRDHDKFMLRLPDGMRDQIKRVADANGRSMNAEMIIRLQASLMTESGLAPVIDAIENLKRALAQVEGRAP